MRIPPSGQQFQLASGSQECVVTELGATIRAYRDGGHDVLHPYDVEAMCDGGHGAPLIPWPNRIRNGRYEWDGETYQLALTEPAKRNAIHGLLRWQPWQARERSADRVVMWTRLHPVSGYPFMLDVTIDYALDADGLSVTTTATNTGSQACPFGSGHHPYLSAGDGLVDECTVQLAAGARITTEDEQQSPVGTESVAGTPYDLSEPVTIGELEIDHAFLDLERDADGLAWVRLGRPDGSTVELWADETYPIIQLYTADTLSPSRRRTAMAAEPMTCPPNAFQSGELLRRLEPDESATSRWGVRLR